MSDLTEAAAPPPPPAPTPGDPPANYKFPPPMHPDGNKFVVIAAALTLFLWFIADWDVLGWLSAGLTAWVFAFFRDPVRVTPQGDDLVVSPADGLVSQIMDVPAPREIADGERGIGAGTFTRISIFMSVFDVHVNRSPVAGTLRNVVYVPGKFLNAELDKASEDNERQYFVVEARSGARVGFTQIAGLVARRIVRFSNVGDDLKVGQRVGLIRFGSRVDVFLPAGYVPQVMVGQRATAGETVLARLGAGERPRGVSQ
jgi:phosphatidylserine decarboxylase